jgi:putative dimethyl sulfoxide reductase chaperone
VSGNGLPGASAALLLARWWSRPTAEELESWNGLWPPAYDTALALATDAEPIEQLHEALGRSEVDALLDGYERLMVGPGRPPCAPYESLWRTDAPPAEQGSLMSGAADAIQRVYGDLGLRMRTDARELPDHLLVEWEALAAALDHHATEPARELLREHLAAWMAPFCRAVAAETEEPFYAVLAGLTPIWTAALAA